MTRCIPFWYAALAAMGVGAGDARQPMRLGQIDATGKQQAQWVVFSRDGRTLATSNSDGTIRVFDVASRKEACRITQPDGHPLLFFIFGPVNFAANGKALVALGPANLVCIWDLPAGKEQKRLSWRGELIDEFGFAPDGRTLAVQTFVEDGGDYRIHLWDTIAGKEMRSIKIRPERCRHRTVGQGHGPVFSPDGRRLASATAGSMIRFWDAATGKELGQLKVDDWSSVSSFAFSPDGKLLVSASSSSGWFSRRNAIVQLWEVASCKRLLADEVEEWHIESVAFSPDGRTFAAACTDGPIRVWDVISGKRLLHFQDMGNKAHCVAYSPDGKVLASAMSDGTAVLWKLAPEPLRSTAESWDKLADSDGKLAYRAVHTLSAYPEALALFKARLKPVPQVKSDRIRSLISRLGDEEFAAREAATTDLYRLGPQVEAELRQAVANADSPEIRRRGKLVLERLSRWTIDDPETLRGMRAVWVLERMGTPAARDLLAELAKGAPEARLTQEAQAALRRLQRK